MLNYYNFGKRESFFGKISPFEAFFKDSEGQGSKFKVQGLKFKVQGVQKFRSSGVQTMVGPLNQLTNSLTHFTYFGTLFVGILKVADLHGICFYVYLCSPKRKGQV